MARLMSDAEIRRRKKAQSVSSKIGGTLGLTALGGTLLATRRGQGLISQGAKLLGREHPPSLRTESIKSKVEPVLATAAGVGGASAFNFAAYTNAEARKRKMLVPQPKKKKISKYSRTQAGFKYYHYVTKDPPWNHPQLLAFGGAGGAAAAADSKRAKKGYNEKGKKAADRTAGAVGGAVAGQAAYQGAGYAAKYGNIAVNDRKVYSDAINRRGYKSSHYKKINEKAKHEAGMKKPNLSADQKAKAYFNYARTTKAKHKVPGYQIERGLSYTHGGKTGMAVGAAATAAGAIAGYRHMKKKELKKAYDPERKRAKRNERYEKGLHATAVGSGAVAGIHAAKAVADAAPRYAISRAPVKRPTARGTRLVDTGKTTLKFNRTKKGSLKALKPVDLTKKPLPLAGLHHLQRPAVKSVSHSGKALLFGAGAIGAEKAAKSVHRRRTGGGSWT